MDRVISVDFERNLAVARAQLEKLHRSIDDTSKAVRSSRILCEESLCLLERRCGFESRAVHPLARRGRLSWTSD